MNDIGKKIRTVYDIFIIAGIVFMITVGYFKYYEFVNNIKEKQEVITELKDKFASATESLASERKVKKELEDQNKNLSDSLKDANAKLKNYTRITIAQREDIADLEGEVKKWKEENGDYVDRVAFSQDFGDYLVEGYYQADKIIGNPSIHFNNIRRERNIDVVDTTNTGTIVDSNMGSGDLTVSSLDVARPFWKNFSIITEGGISRDMHAKIKTSILYKKIVVGYEFSSDPTIWFGYHYSWIK